jgi:hypothetical protein
MLATSVPTVLNKRIVIKALVFNVYDTVKCSDAGSGKTVKVEMLSETEGMAVDPLSTIIVPFCLSHANYTPKGADGGENPRLPMGTLKPRFVWIICIPDLWTSTACELPRTNSRLLAIGKSNG